MRNFKGKLAILMATAMLCGTAFGSAPAIAADSAASGETRVLFSTSFEADESAPLVGQVEGDRLHNVGVGGGTQSLTESYNALVDQNSIAGSADFHDGESKKKLFDSNKDTKWLNNEGAPSADSPRWVSFALNEAKVSTAYMIQSANDSSERDPMDWTVYGSADGSSWTVLDTRSDVYFDGRYEAHVYTFANETAYKHYKLEITKNRGNNNMTQLASFEMGVLTVSADDANNAPAPLTVEVGTGPSVTWCNTANDGWTGNGALTVTGRNIAEGNADCANVLYDNLSIPVDDNTELDYVIFPSFYTEDSDGYDFGFYNMHFMIDLAFSDGTYLSDLGAVDQNGIGMTPQEQADGKCLYTMQWNEVRTRIGSVAKGKTINKVLLYYAYDNAEGGKSFRAFFDDIQILSKPEKVYEHLSDYVNPLRGTNSTGSFSRGLTVPAVTVPNGFNYYIPVTNTRSNAPYFYQLSDSKNTMAHFEITHIASNWVGGWGSWQFMANTSVAYSAATASSLNSSSRAAAFSHANEESKAHYYGVTFNEGSKASGVKMEMTPTDHALFVRATFPQDAANRNIVFDCDHANGGMVLSNVSKDGSFTAYSDHNQNGSTRMYIYGQFVDASGNPLTTGTSKVMTYTDGNKSSAIGLTSFPEGTTEVGIKLATSYMSYAQAEKNLNLEIAADATFDDVFTAAQKTWDELLGMIELEGATEEQLITFYSCLYRMYMYPTNYSENTGTAEKPVMSYASPYQKGKVVEGQMYTNNGFWDTYRTAWAGYALLTPNRDTGYLNGLIQHYKDSGWVPRWINPAGTNSMVGTSSDVIFGDAAVKGIQFDMEAALDSAIKNATVVSDNLTNGGRRALETSNFLGYTSLENDQAFSWAMEGYINDYGISQLAEVVGRSDEAAYFRNRSRYYVNLFNDNLGWFMGKNQNGEFRTNSANFNPSGWGWGGDYTETNAWNMAFTVVQDGQGLANLYGGRRAMEEKLDALFNDDLRNTFSGGIHEMKEAREVRMGQYHHSNQPAHHLIYMYNYAGTPYKTAEKVRDILTHGYAGQNIGQGYIGDEDNGEMSAWYVFSALGFYPVSMGNDEYAIGSPLFTKATIHMDNGKDLVINAPNTSRENIYIQSMKFNGEDYNKAYFKHADLAKGGVIDIVMGSEPSSWGMAADSLPTSITKGEEAADPAMDVTKGLTMEANRILGSRTEQLAGESAYQNLFDDTSSTVVKLSEDTTVFNYFNPEGRAISAYTVTSGSDPAAAPTGYTLTASQDGKTWVELDARTNVSFAWAKYTKPFAIAKEKQAVYKYYRLTITGRGTLAELELLGTKDVLSEGTPVDEAALAASMDSQIEAIGTVTSLTQKPAVEKARADYEALERSTQLQVKKLEALAAAEAAIKKLEDSGAEVRPGDVDNDGKVTVSDVVLLRQLIVAGSWTDREFAAGNLDDSDQNLTVSDVVALRSLIVQGA